MTSGLKLSHKAFILVSAPLILQLLFVATLYFCWREAQYQAWKADRGRSIIVEGGRLCGDFAYIAQNLMLFRVTDDARFEARYKELMQDVPKSLKALHTLVKGNPVEERITTRVDRLSQKILETARTLHDTLVSGGSSNRALLQLLQSEVLSDIAKLGEEARKLVVLEKLAAQDNPTAKEASARFIELCLLTGLSLSIILAGTLALYYNRSTTGRLKTLMENTALLLSGKPLNPPVSGADEISHLDKTFHDMADALQESERMKRQYVAFISHELRTPLTSMNLLLELMDQEVFGKLSEKGHKKVHGVQREAARVLNLIDDLLDSEKLAAGQLDIDPSVIDLSRVVQLSVDAVQSVAERANITLEVVAGDGFLAFADQRRIMQVLVNLLSNAVKFSPGGTTVGVSVKAVDHALEVRVKDEGRGIPAGYKELIFERFRQVDPSDAVEKRGSGLGLALCKAIIEQHGGTIGVESEPGKGSTFWFTLPASAVAQGTVEQQELRQQ